jgi:hypothetical protein
MILDERTLASHRLDEGSQRALHVLRQCLEQGYPAVGAWLPVRDTLQTALR